MPADTIVVVTPLTLKGTGNVFFIQFPIDTARGAPSYESFTHLHNLVLRKIITIEL
jgi:hypothetical protein